MPIHEIHGSVVGGPSPPSGLCRTRRRPVGQAESLTFPVGVFRAGLDEFFAYLRRLRETASSRGEVFAGRIRKMQEGHFTTVEELEKKTGVM